MLFYEGDEIQLLNERAKADVENLSVGRKVLYLLHDAFFWTLGTVVWYYKRSLTSERKE